MGKKRFSEGLDDLFKDSPAEQHHRVETRPPTPERKGAPKNFMLGLDALLQEALEESLEKYAANQPDSTTPSASAKTKTSSADFFRPGQLTGLDAVIRQTIDVQEINLDESTGKRRLTVAVDKT
ncbi:MAG: hypothetical protein LH618_15370 [Saprospiraceae bacterium]|nr:hypothetical protein [Saprospiraceae bacterium]